MRCLDYGRASIMVIRCDYLVVGGGIAGLTFAIEVARDADVVVVTKRLLTDSATANAQGGIAAVLDPADSFDQHIHDTLEAGRGLSHPDVVEMVVRDGPDRIRELVRLGAAFSRSEDGSLGSLDLTREGGHSARRVVHAGDITGARSSARSSPPRERNPRIRCSSGTWRST